MFVYGQLVYDDTDIVYQLRIEQLPNHIELISADLSPVRLYIRIYSSNDVIVSFISCRR